MKATIIVTAMILFAGLALAAESGNTGNKAPCAGDIVAKANHVALYQGTGMTARVQMTITDKQGRVRRRTLNIIRQDAMGDGDGDQKFFTYFKAPADVRKMVFMVHKHSDPLEDDDRWLYMPAMDLVKRIAAGDKRTSFVGSDFLYEDISGRDIHEDSHALIRVTDRHYVLENRPKHPERVCFSHYLAYVDRTTFITEKMEFYKQGNILYRVMSVLEIEQIPWRNDVYPTVIRSEARNLETGTVTQMTLSRIRYNPEIKDIFSERYLRRPPREVTR